MSPTDHIKYSELVDITKLQALMESFSQIIGIANAVIDVDGIVITHAGWQQACTDFHRINTDTCRRCIESDISLVESMTQGSTFAVYRCLNGLVDTAAPIIIEGKHVANVFTGQFLTEPPDLDFFRKQALQFGFDETSYLEAIAKVPILPGDRVEAITRLYAQLAGMLADNGLDRLIQKKTVADLANLNAALEEKVIARTQALRECEERWKFALEGAGDGVWDWNIQTGETLFSKRWKEMIGYAEDEFGNGNETWKQHIHPEDMVRVSGALQDYFDGKIPLYSLEYRLKCKDGSWKWMLTRGMVVSRSGNGKPLRMIGTHADITERKEAEEVITKSRNRYQGILHNMMDAYWRVDTNGRIVEANMAISQMHGYSIEELLQMSVSDFEVIESAEDTRKHIETIKKKGHAFFESKHWCKDGRIIDVEISANLSVDDPDYADAFHRDITKRKQLSQQVADLVELQQKILSTSLVGILAYRADTGECVLANEVSASILGATIEQILKQNYLQINSWNNSGLLQAAQKTLLSGTDVRHEFHIITTFGKDVWIETLISSFVSQGKKHLLLMLEDISERKQAEKSMQLASLVYENSSEAMIVTDAVGTIITINPAFTKQTGYTAVEAIGQNMHILNSGHHDQTFFQDMWVAINTTGHWQGEIWNRRKNGEIFIEWLTINAIRDTDGSVHRWVALFSDITKKKQSEELIWQQANFDLLTGLPNRRMFHDRLEQELKKAHRAGLPLALLFLDLDHFKEVNDTLGHDMGDLLLEETAQRINSCVRETDTVARLGGDEFTIILGELDDPGSVERIAQDILGKLSEPFQLGVETVYVSASIGITLYPSDAEDIDTLLKQADQAMYAAKQQGRNRFSYFTQSMQKAAESRMLLAKDLRHALEADQFEVYYQPIVELATSAIHKAEALLRWKHPTHGFISPTEFIPIAEDTGMIHDIGNWVFQEAARQVKHFRAVHDPSFQISINKSPVQFLNQSQVHIAWFDHLQQLGLPGESIVVEITEGLLLDASTAVTDQLLQFRDQGVQVSLDDFGTGYSSLSYLKKFDIDYLKIDQSFTRNLAPGTPDFALCEAIVTMAHKLGLKVIAEGVETEQQQDLLKQIGCDFGQGYLFSRPVPAKEFEKLLAKA